MWKSFFLRTTAFDLAASFLMTNLLRLAAPVLQPTDDLRYHLQISANSPGPTPAEQQLLSAHFLSALARELQERSVSLTVVEGLWSPRCTQAPYQANARSWRALMHELSRRGEFRFVPASELPAPPPELFIDCVHLRYGDELSLEFRERYQREFLRQIPQT